MFSVKFKHAFEFKNIISVVKDFVEEISLVFDQNGLYSQSMDSSHISLIIISLPKSDFSLYKCGQKFVFDIHVKTLFKILKCTNTPDFELELRFNQQKQDVMEIYLNEKDLKYKFILKLMDIDIEMMDIPAQTVDCSFKMPSVQFNKTMKNLSNFGDVCKFQCGKKKLKIVTEGDAGDVELELEVADYDFSVNENIELDYSTRYLLMFSQAFSINKTVVFQIATEQPLFIDFGKISFYLAPKMEDR